jgi:hypothetical protein
MILTLIKDNDGKIWYGVYKKYIKSTRFYILGKNYSSLKNETQKYLILNQDQCVKTSFEEYYELVKNEKIRNSSAIKRLKFFVSDSFLTDMIIFGDYICNYNEVNKAIENKVEKIADPEYDYF